ncbi:amidohydrolase family protein, partial [Porticoccaceae bacterium]|nr:amidohydrolase family protein [Porticoccaceae bacterium]
QFTEAEIRAVVAEADTHRRYVMAHCHTDQAIRRCVEYGVRTIEHGSEIHAETAALIARENAFVVPTLSVVNIIQQHGAELNLSAAGLEKSQGLYDSMREAITTCAAAGVKLGLGTDILDDRFHPLQGGELALRGELSPALEVLRSATSVNAEILQKSGELGCIAAGAYADMLVLEGNPLEDLSLFRDSDNNIPVIMKGGELVRQRLPSTAEA